MPHDTQTPTSAPLSSDQIAVLRALCDLSWDPLICFPFAPIVRETGLEVARVRAAARHLRALGLAEYHRGIFSADGEVAGSYPCFRAWSITGAAMLSPHVNINRLQVMPVSQSFNGLSIDRSE